MKEENVIISKGLTKRFGGFTAVDAITFEVKKGEIFGFLGANGAGKTTAMKMLIGISNPTEQQTENVSRNKRRSSTNDYYTIFGFLSQKVKGARERLWSYDQMEHNNQCGGFMTLSDKKGGML